MTKKSSTNKKNILIIDDDNGILELLTDVLQDKFNITTSASSEEALKKMTSSKFQIMLIDIFLPVMTGVDILKFVKKHYPETVVLMMSGSPTLDLAVELTKAGAWDVLQKPLDISNLEGQIFEALKNHKTTKSYPFEMNFMSSIPPEFRIHKILMSNDHSMVLKVERNSEIYAMKILKYEGYDENYQKKVHRFFREAEIMMNISHPNIIRIYESEFKDGKLPYILMEYLPDSTLNSQLIQQMDWETRFMIICRLADALNSIHKAGILHRDIKPSNVMIAPDGEPRLSDFGIAGLPDSSLTMTKEIVGSPKFMAPEAFISLRKTDIRSDIFSFGILIYIIATNQHPFSGNTLEEIIQSVSTQRPIRPSLLNSDIPKDLDDILAGMLGKYQSQRYQNMEHVIADLNLCNTGKAKNNFIHSIFRHFRHFSNNNQWCKDMPTKHKNT